MSSVVYRPRRSRSALHRVAQASRKTGVRVTGTLSYPGPQLCSLLGSLLCSLLAQPPRGGGPGRLGISDRFLLPAHRTLDRNAWLSREHPGEPGTPPEAALIPCTLMPANERRRRPDPVAAAEDWVARTAAQVREEGERRHPGEVPTCASGISPSGPVHLGNLRELMTPHLVADEVRRNGAPCRHILSWDDYDRLRRVPLGVPSSWEEHIGRPLTGVPDPCGQHENFAEHFKEPLLESLDRLGIQVTQISQTEMYTSGAYTAQIVLAMRRRADIGAVLGRYRTKRTDALPADEDDEDGPQAAVYYPFRPYCATCGRDDTTVTGFDDETTEVTYTCACD